MGQKINPHGFRVGVNKNWDSRWYSAEGTFGDTLIEDYNLRKYLMKKLTSAGVPDIEIERNNTDRIRIFIHCAKPGIVIGKGGADIDKLRLDLEKMLKKPVSLNVVEVKSPDMNAQLVAESIASQLERRISFRRAMKQSIGRTMRVGAKGIKVAVKGRLGGAEIARSEHYHEGTIPLQTLRADIDYGFSEANTTYGKIGVKVWIYKGEILPEVARQTVAGTAVNTASAPRDNDRRNNNRRNNDHRDRRDSFGQRDRRSQGRGQQRQQTNNAPIAPRQRITTGGAKNDVNA